MALYQGGGGGGRIVDTEGRGLREKSGQEKRPDSCCSL